jgi:2,3-bisphosphoglycerate-independent phosphoglycerate mutase
MPPGSDVANMSLLGYDPARFHTGRGPIEAAAQGLDLSERDLVWRLNLVTVSEFAEQGLMRDYSAGHIANEPARALIRGLQEQLGDDVFSFVPGIQYRHLLIQKDGADSAEAGLAINPPHDITDRPVGPDWQAFASSPRLMRLLREAAARLAGPDNPTKANSLWPWGQGKPLHLPSFLDTVGLRGGVISAVDLVKGLGRAAGMEVIEVRGATGLLDTNYAGKVEAALHYLKRGDFVFLHVEAPDECGHGGNPADKVEAIRRFDARIVGPMLHSLQGTDTGVLIACDHLTPVTLRTHAPDPVPFLLVHMGGDLRGADRHSAPVFTEETARGTGLRIEPGHGLLAWAVATLKAGGC